MTFSATMAFAAAALAAALGLVPLFRPPRSVAKWAFATGMLAFATEAMLIGLALGTWERETLLFWQRFRLLAMSFIPGTWLLFSLTYSRGNYKEFLKRWQPALAAAFIVPPALLFVSWNGLLSQARDPDSLGAYYPVFGWPTTAMYVCFVLGAIVVLMHLERTFRASVGTMRWRIKFMVLALGFLFAVRIYTASQSLLYSSVILLLQQINVIALLLACLLMAASLFRAGFLHLDIYPSHTVLHRSLAVMLAGMYLLTIGILAKVAEVFGHTDAFPLKAFLVLVSILLLAVLFLSDRLREVTRRFVSRQFHRPRYDYRRIWSTFTGQMAPLTDQPALCRTVARWVSETFNALSVTIWVHDEVRQKFTCAASTVLSESKAAASTELDAGDAEFTRALKERAFPVDLDASDEPALRMLKQSNPDVFGKGGGRVCVPLVSGEDLLGLMVLTDRVSGVPFSFEDLELLKCIGDQIAGSLLNARLSQRLLEAREMEAFQNISAFFVHDLKNTASTLSLMLQNLPVHFDDPAFREDALRGLSKSVSRINDLIGRLSLLRQGLDLKLQDADLNEIAGAALASLNQVTAPRLVRALQPLPKVHVDPDRIQKVIANIVFNAVEAAGPSGEVRVETTARDGWAALAVIDNGCGMSPEFLRHSLFRPFQTTKKKGIGIGLFLSKAVVEAHKGKIEVESQPGQGTTFRVLLPSRGGTK